MQPSHRHDASRALERVRAALALGHGSVKRIDENRDLLELLLTDAPGVLCRHPWVIGWIETNDRVFCALHAALVDAGLEHDRKIPMYPRPWPQDRLDALDAWARFGAAAKASRGQGDALAPTGKSSPVDPSDQAAHSSVQRDPAC